MRYGQIRKYDIANGPGIRCSLFVTGCRRHCKGCFNEEYQSFQAGKEFNEDSFQELLSYYTNQNVTGLTILGGEPFEPENTKTLAETIIRLKKVIWKPVWIYSGYKFEELTECEDFLSAPSNVTEEQLYRLALLGLCEVLVDGEFDESLKDPSLRFRGSFNQRIIDAQKSTENWRVVLWEDPFLKEDTHEGNKLEQI